MNTHRVYCAAIFLVSLTTAVFAAPPADVARQKSPKNTASLDYDTYINANRILAFVTNDGNCFTDTYGLFGRTDGFYYPYTSITDILSGSHAKTVVYTAGIWLGGKVDGQVRVAVADYSSEYVPGPFGESDDPTFHVYKLYSDSVGTNANADYLNWPVDQGAPTDEEGKPALVGDQMTWAVFNDADPTAHTNNAGSTQPLGVEVRMTTWAFDRQGLSGDVVHVKYLLFNKGVNNIDSFYISFWADPDLGDASDDLIGCDTLNGIFYCYNGDNNDGQYGSLPPAWGGRLVSGPVAYSPGSVATFNGHVLIDYRNLPMTAFALYINGTDPNSSSQTYNYMKGLQANGSAFPNGRKFMCPGNPVNGTGDLDVNPADRRLMSSSGPFTFLAGDSQQIVLEFAAAQSNSRLNSITEFKSRLIPSTCCLGSAGPAGNIDCSPNPDADISDLTALIDYLFIHFAPLCCPAEADCEPSGNIDIGDLTALINYMFFGTSPLPSCP